MPIPSELLTGSECFGLLYFDELGRPCESANECEVSPACKKLCEDRIAEASVEKQIERVRDKTNPDILNKFKRELHKFSNELLDRIRKESSKKKVKARKTKHGSNRKRHEHGTLTDNNEDSVGLKLLSLACNFLKAESSEIVSIKTRKLYANVILNGHIMLRLWPRKPFLNVFVTEEVVNPLAQMGFTVFAVTEREIPFFRPLVGYVQVSTEERLNIVCRVVHDYIISGAKKGVN